ncbi:Conserved_hypothetical protein [Hexamita inflata]|uniref:Uncharacterized protein n=1 Tax=Hexamita inflata TaxID=28002 RepID=A0AA86PLL0_9EUKA|nr:Conserved hypothetical protein [Hexamita inflata]
MCQGFFSFQSLINEFLNPGISGKVKAWVKRDWKEGDDENSQIKQLREIGKNGQRLVSEMKELPFAYYTADPRVKKFYNLDLFNTTPKIASMTDKYKEMSKMNAKIDSTDYTKMAVLMNEQNEMRQIQNEITAMQNLCGHFKYSPVFGQFQDYVLGTQNFFAGKITLDACFQNIIDKISGAEATRTPDELAEMTVFACRALLGYTVLDLFTPRNNPVHFSTKQAFKLVSTYVNQDDAELNSYFEKTKAAVDNLAPFEEQNDWKNIQNFVQPALKHLTDQQIHCQFQRPEFISGLEEDDLSSVKARYQKRPNLVALAELAALKQLPESEFGCVKSFKQSNNDVFQDAKIVGPMTFIYQIGGISTGEASAVMNFEYYAKFGMFEKNPDDDQYEVGRILNQRVVLVSDKINTFAQWADNFITGTK